MVYKQLKQYQFEQLNVETNEHVKAVSDLCYFVGKKLNLTDDKLYLLREMAFFHDIGKSKIPLEVLERNGPLTDEEFEEVKRHPEYGRDILREFGFTDEELKIIYQHHERCDGSGYPLGIKKPDIAMEARIICVIDVFDALLSDRAYKKAWPEEKVKEFFRNRTHEFCFEAVNVMLENFDEMIEIRKGDYKEI